MLKDRCWTHVISIDPGAILDLEDLETIDMSSKSPVGWIGPSKVRPKLR